MKWINPLLTTMPYLPRLAEIFDLNFRRDQQKNSDLAILTTVTKIE